MLSRKVSIAPMMACTDRHYRYFMRLLSRHTLLYSEMVTTGAILHGDRQKLLGFSDIEHPLALQLGGSDPQALATSARFGEDFGYDEINLNVGCPSDRVQSGSFGACLMKQPELVAECMSAMISAVSVPVTIKTRIGVDNQDSYQQLKDFASTIAAAGCKTFIIHARKAWLQGLSPRQNREIPPLRYEMVYQLKRDLPTLEIIINGGVKTKADLNEHLQHVDGVMIGREAYSNPYFFADVDQQFFGESKMPISEMEAIVNYLPYIAQQVAGGVPMRRVTRFLVGMFHGQPGARRWRRYLSENMSKTNHDGVGVIQSAMQQLGLPPLT